MSGNPLEDILNHWASMSDCRNCGMLYDADVDGDVCSCCKKAHNERALREVTLDTARVDYSETNGSFFDTASENSSFVGVTSRGKSGKFVKKAKRAPATVAAEAVMNEFENALIADGFAIGVNGDGTAMKYSRYMRMLFDNGIFSTRADFFKAGARARAQKFYRSKAEQKALENGGKTTAKKLYRNFANGFDKYVLLCADMNIDSEIPVVEKPVEEDVTDTAWVDDLLNELGIELCE